MGSWKLFGKEFEFMKIETLKTNALVPYARNAKTHPPAQISRIAGSIKEFGFCNPVLIDKDNGIIAGHGRVLAAQQLGRKCRAIEISPGYVAVAIQRWADATGKEPNRL